MKYIFILSLAALQFVQYIFDDDQYVFVAWTVNDFTIAALSILAFINAGEIKEKCLWAIFSMWQVTILSLNEAYIETDWPILVILIDAIIFIVLMLVIVRKMTLKINKKKVTICNDNYHFIYRSKFTWLAFLGSVLPRVQYLCSSVAVCTKDDLWCVKDGVFVKHNHENYILNKHKHSYINHVVNSWKYRPMAIKDSGICVNDAINKSLDSLVGKPIIIGMRDCFLLKKIVTGVSHAGNTN